MWGPRQVPPPTDSEAARFGPACCPEERYSDMWKVPEAGRKAQGDIPEPGARPGPPAPNRESLWGTNVPPDGALAVGWGGGWGRPLTLGPVGIPALLFIPVRPGQVPPPDCP